MKKTQVNSEFAFAFQYTHWVTFCSQDGFYLAVNLHGTWRVRNQGNTLEEFFDSLAFNNASNFYIETLLKTIPEHKIAVEFL
jgi:hypothetical protein